MGPQALSFPFPEKKSVWIAHSEFEERKSKRAKSPGQLACSLVFRERGAGVPGASGCCCLQLGTCTDSQGQRLSLGSLRWRPPVRAPHRTSGLAEGRALSPEACLVLDTGPACPPGRGCRARAACGAGAALCPPLLPPGRSAPLSGWVSRGRVPIMNERRQGLARSGAGVRTGRLGW